jgi:hypothetical protein
VGEEVFAFSGERADAVNDYNRVQFENAAVCSGIHAVVAMLVAMSQGDPA